MTEKEIVKDFVDFLEKHSDSIVCTGENTYTYKILKDSIIRTLSMAYGDGEVKGFTNARSEELFDKTLISNKEDW